MRFSLRFIVYILAFFLAGAFLSPVHADENLQFPDSFIIELHVGTVDGPLLSAPLGVNEELLVSCQIPQLGDPANPVLANVIWQLYTSSGEPIPEFNKTRQIIGIGNQEFCLFRVRSGELANGLYFIGLTHQLASDPSSYYQSSLSFEVRQPVAVKRIVIDETPRGQVNQRIFYEDQSPHIFVYYYLADDVSTALVQIDVLDETGTVRASRTLYKDKDFTRPRERVGIKLPPGLFRAGERAIVRVSLSTPDDTTVTAKSWFEVLSIDLGISLPETIVQGTIVDFQLFEPQTFMSPYTVEFNHQDGFIFKSEPGSLIGKLFVSPAAEVGRHQIGITVTDSHGNRASGAVVMEVLQGTMRSYQRRKKMQNTDSDRRGGHIGSSTRR